MACNRRPGTRRGFTLIEILVVVAIISLLVSILLPSLSKAREQARAAVCSSSLGNACRAMAAYQTSRKGWIPGSPLTTGRAIAEAGAFVPNRNVVEWMDWATPLRIETQGITSIPNPKTAADPTEARKDMFELVTAPPFHCPSNPVVYRAWNGGAPLSDWPVIRATSYLAMWTMTRGGWATGRRAQQDFPLVSNVETKVAVPPSWGMEVPDDYVPRISRVGRESMKVFLADGFRFYAESGTMDYNVDPVAYKGMMQGEPPSTWAKGEEDIDREYVTAKALSYRHGNKDRIVAGFFDGHVRALIATTKVDDDEMPFTGSAVHPKWYYPSGTVVKDPGRLHRPIPSGTVLP